MAYTSRARRPSASSASKARSTKAKSSTKADGTKATSAARRSAPKPAKRPVTSIAKAAKTKTKTKAKIVAKAKKPARSASARASKPAKKPVNAVKRGQSSAGLSAIAPLAREVRRPSPATVPNGDQVAATVAPSEPVTAVGSVSIADLLERARPQVHPWSPPLEREHNRLTRRALAAHHPGFDRRRLKHQGMVAPRGEPSHRTDQRKSKTP